MSYDVMYIARDVYFTEEFFSDVVTTVTKYRQFKDVRVNGIIYDKNSICVMLENNNPAANHTQEWMHNMYRHGQDASFGDVESLIKSRLREIKLEKIGI